nr:peroxisomal membrane protein 11B [Leptinotarsa decemlineata]
MDKIIKINNQTAGRDKIARLLQYISRFLWHRLQQSNKDGVAGLKNLEFQLSTFRKLLRFGRFAEGLYTALPLFQQEDIPTRYTIILSKIANSLFLLADHFLWLGRADICAVDTEKWSRISNKYWLYSITMNLMRDFYEISLIVKSEKSNIIPKNGLRNFADIMKALSKLSLAVQMNQNVVIDTVKNGCDFFIPLTALGHVKLSPGTVGFLGAISSIAGLLVLLEPSKKLTP